MQSVNHKYSSIICIDGESNRCTLCISNDYNVYSCGFSEYGILGHMEENILQFTPIKELYNIKMISCGGSHAICLDFNGIVYSFGSNSNNKLGCNNEITKTFIPQKLNLPFIILISCGDHFTMCLTDNGDLYSFGKNSDGQLGLGDFNSHLFPKQITSLHNIEYIECGGSHTICKTYDNRYFSWGFNDCGQLGYNSKEEKCNMPTECLIFPKDIVSIKCGLYHTLLLTNQGKVFGCGDNIYSQLGLNNTEVKKVFKPILIQGLPSIQQITCGSDHSICIDIDSNLWVFGANSFGQLGLSDDLQKIKPIKHPTLSNIIDISCKGNHTFVKTIDNKIYAFGNNSKLQLGIKTSENYQLTPIQVFIDNEDIWCSTIGKSRQKSARK